MEEAILNAAEQLFLAKGFASASTTEIAKLAGCNQALVHYYYRTKDKLFEAVFARKAPLFFAALFNQELEALPFEERMARRIRAHFDVLAQNPRVPFLVVDELFVNPGRLETLKPAIRPVLKGALAQVQAELDAEAASGRIRQVDALDFMLSVLFMNIGFFMTLPIWEAAFEPDAEERKRRFEERKRCNVEYALRYLRN